MKTAAGITVVLAALLAVAVGRSDAVGRRTMVLGRSADGRPIVAIESGDLDAQMRVLVVGCIHGNEPAGIAVAESLAQDPRRARGLDLWIVPDLNPDGVAADTRGNAHGVDLNRNFPWRWRPLGGIFDAGSHALSEPESRLAYRLVERIRPSVAIWFHQHRDVVDESGGSVSVERRFAALSGLQLVRLPREPGSAVGWENQAIRSGTAFVVELPAGTLSASAVERLARAILLVAPAASRR